jgi:flagellar biosynthesis protein FlhA
MLPREENTPPPPRAEVAEEADFFGSMDGASKFVRGDAIAGLLILFITMVGGFIIGMTMHGMSAGQAASSYVTLAVGDALVAQIPALLISVASAIVVSRVGKEQDTTPAARCSTRRRPSAWPRAWWACWG